MAIQPNTTLKILKGIPFDDTYENTILFDTVTNQTNYFSNKVKPSANGVIYTLSNYSYQRANKNSIRVQIKADNLYDCNYIMFQNSSYGNKWFYAFIKAVNYVNDVTSEIVYEIDDIQTWHFDYTLADTFVEREHSATDSIGDNLIEEQLELGELIENDWHEFVNITGESAHIIIYAPFDATLNKTFGKLVAGINSVYTGLNCIAFPLTSAGVSACNNFLSSVDEQGWTEAITGMYIVPASFQIYTDANGNVSNFGGVYPQNASKVLKNKTTIDGYSPRNKKLLTYPYNFLRIVSDNNTKDFRYEFFGSTNECEFEIDYTIFPIPTLVINPKYYLRNSNIPHLPGEVWIENKEHRMTITDYPQCAYTSDVYKIYVAQNQGSIAAKQFAIDAGAISGMSNNLISGMFSAAFGNVGGAVSGAMGVANSATNAMIEANNLMGQLRDVRALPTQVNGTQTSMADYSLNFKSFIGKNMCITNQFARRLDKFFDMYGYKTLNVKKPYRHSRQLWTYCKTVGCDIHGSIPVDSASKICSIYDRGITWWWCNSSVTLGSRNYKVDDIIGEYNIFASYNTPLGNNAQ